MKHLPAILLLFCLLLALPACGGQTQADDDTTLTVAATTYPVYLFTTALTEGVSGVEVELIVNEPTSCLHDYTLTVQDMKVIERADVLIMNGAGLEMFMESALERSDAHLISCDRNLTLLSADGHAHHHEHDHEHDHGHEDDPHFWLSPGYAAHMLSTIAEELTALDQTNEPLYSHNLTAALDALSELEMQQAEIQALGGAHLITFHDGFRYFAQDCGLDLLRSIEAEEGSEASAAEIVEIVDLIREHHVDAIFTELNGSDATAATVSRETGVAVGQLNMIMSGEGAGIQPYLDAMHANYDAILTALGG